MIRLFALDVDGTLTDDGIYMDGKGGEQKRFSIRDGLGLVMLLKQDVRVAFISGRYSACTQQRAEDLRISACVNGTKDKLKELKALAEQWSIKREEIAYAGDDLPDIDCIKWAGLGMAPADALPLAKEAADFVTLSNAGHGAVRECAEKISEINGIEK